jgi:hypothetical protein
MGIRGGGGENGTWDIIAYDESNVEMLREFEMTRQNGREGVEEEDEVEQKRWRAGVARKRD